VALFYIMTSPQEDAKPDGPEEPDSPGVAYVCTTPRGSLVAARDNIGATCQSASRRRRRLPPASRRCATRLLAAAHPRPGLPPAARRAHLPRRSRAALESAALPTAGRPRRRSSSAPSSLGCSGESLGLGRRKGPGYRRRRGTGSRSRRGEPCTIRLVYVAGLERAPCSQ
jgi:hypothetical protein